jgi:hydroxyethylthiazole kinase
VRGVDSVGELVQPEQVVKQAASEWKCVVAITGRRDLVSDGNRTIAVGNGHEWLTHLTGTGCMSTAMVACFSAVEPDALYAATAGLAAFGVAAELAAARTDGPGSFKTALFDELYRLSASSLTERASVVPLD